MTSNPIFKQGDRVRQEYLWTGNSKSYCGKPGTVLKYTKGGLVYVLFDGQKSPISIPQSYLEKIDA